MPRFKYSLLAAVGILILAFVLTVIGPKRVMAALGFTPVRNVDNPDRAPFQDSFSLQIRDDSGRSYSFWKHEIAQVNKQRGKSPMPSYKGQLSEDELTDLIAYLASLKEEK